MSSELHRGKKYASTGATQCPCRSLREARPQDWLRQCFYHINRRESWKEALAWVVARTAHIGECEPVLRNNASDLHEEKTKPKTRRVDASLTITVTPEKGTKPVSSKIVAGGNSTSLFHNCCLNIFTKRTYATTEWMLRRQHSPTSKSFGTSLSFS